MFDWDLMIFQRLIDPETTVGDRVTFDSIHEDEFRRFLHYLHENPRLKIRYHYYPDLMQLQIKVSSLGHQRVSGFFFIRVIQWNTANFPAYPYLGEGPVQCNLSATITDAHCEPDNQFQLTGRAYGNLVLEVGNAQVGADIVRDLKRYFVHTPGIMLAVGVKYWPQGQNTAMAIIIYERSATPNNPVFPFNRGVLRQRISFGNGNFHGNALNSMNQSIDADAFPNDGRADHPWEGVGFGAAPCDRLNLPGYLVSFPSRYLLCFDNLGDLNISPFFNNILLINRIPCHQIWLLICSRYKDVFCAHWNNVGVLRNKLKDCMWSLPQSSLPQHGRSSCKPIIPDF